VRFSDDLGRMLPILVVGFLVAALTTLALTPVVRRLAWRYRIVDRPEARRVNTRTMARAGGVGVAIGFVGVSLAMLGLNAAVGWPFIDQADMLAPGALVALLGGAVLAVLLGLADDRFDLLARWQFVGQLALAGFAVALGVSVSVLNDPFSHGTIQLAGAVAVTATLFWIVGMVNAMNFIDGLDGLSSGIALIAAVCLGLISLVSDSSQPAVALLCFVLAGALLGFLRWNFHPATIFAGTSGIMLLGYSLAVLSILGTAKVAVALLVLGVPIIDAFWIIVRRIASGRSPFTPDRGHIHHRLLDLGLSHRATVVLIYGVCILLAVLSLSLSYTGQMYAFLGLVVLSGLVLLAIEQVGGGAEEISEDLCRDSYEPDPNGSKGEGAAGSREK
jgi:UDP-GlcNAc:undecaprenyl-phosphate GlcNAc-1-phosphate transferase